MSLSHNVYLGPYLEASPIVADSYPIIEEMREALAFVRTEGEVKYFELEGAGAIVPDLYIPNVARDGQYREKMHFHPKEEEGVSNLSPAMVREEIAWFRGAFADEIAIVKKHYKRATVRWGLIMWVY